LHGKTELGLNLVAICLLTLVYYSTAYVGLAFAIPPGNATAVWPPSGIALSALIIFGARLWPGVWIGSLLVNHGTGVSLGVSAAIATGNTLEALIALFLCRRLLQLDAPFQDLRFAFRLILIAISACAVAASIGATSLWWGGYLERNQFPWNWITWWLGDLAGVMLVTPVFISVPRPTSWQTPFRTVLEAVLSILFLGVVSQAIFGTWLPERISEGLLYVPLIVVFWLLLRFHPVVVFVGNLLIAMIAVIGTSTGAGPFATEAVTQSLFELQLFMTLYACAGLVLTGILTTWRATERRESQLAAAIQAAEELREKEIELAHVSRLSTVGEMVAGIAHEINQPLYAIANFAAASKQLLGQSGSQNHDQLRTLNRQITEQAVRAGEIIRRLREFVKKTEGSRSPLLVTDALTHSNQLMACEAQRKHVSVRIEPSHDPSVRVFADKIQLEQILVNLLQNSFDAMLENDADNRVTIVRTSVIDADVHISVEDQGVGIADLSDKKLFEPFFTTKTRGMGMGLAISRTIAEAHGGRICANPGRETGTVFTVVLPVYRGND
jgi:two-component system NtrC family sensor kinase